MSIIQEALKKVQRDTERSPAVFKVTKKNNFHPFPILVVLVVSISAVILFQFLPKKGPELKTDALQEIGNVSHQEAIYKPISNIDVKSKEAVLASNGSLEAAREVKTYRPNLILNGIMYLEGGARAIINNTIVMVGDIISGAYVTKIDKKSVVLKSKDEEITLNLK